MERADESIMDRDLEIFIEYEFRPFRDEIIGANKIGSPEVGRLGHLEATVAKHDKFFDVMLGWKGIVAAIIWLTINLLTILVLVKEYFAK